MRIRHLMILVLASAIALGLLRGSWFGPVLLANLGMCALGALLLWGETHLRPAWRRVVDRAGASRSFDAWAIRSAANLAGFLYYALTTVVLMVAVVQSAITLMLISLFIVVWVASVVGLAP